MRLIYLATLCSLISLHELLFMDDCINKNDADSAALTARICTALHVDSHMTPFNLNGRCESIFLCQLIYVSRSLSAQRYTRPISTNADVAYLASDNGQCGS